MLAGVVCDVVPIVDPHADQPVFESGVPVQEAATAVVLLHGRGATADSILRLFESLDLPDIAAFAPQAAGATWYPHSFLAPVQSNQPHLDSALRLVDSVVTTLARRVPKRERGRPLVQRGFDLPRIALLGFSQGACLACEYAARHPHRYGAVIGFSGGLIGPPGTKFDYPGGFERAPVFLGASDIDPHVPLERVRETAATFRRMDALVNLRVYPGMPHTINKDELDAARELLKSMATRPYSQPS